jgi:hypothetical protein
LKLIEASGYFGVPTNNARRLSCAILIADGFEQGTKCILRLRKLWELFVVNLKFLRTLLVSLSFGVAPIAIASTDCPEALGNDLDSQLEAMIGIEGISSAPKDCFEVVLKPRLDRREKHGVRIPKNLKEALDEMHRMIPAHIQEHLVIRADKSYIGPYYDYTCDVEPGTPESALVFGYVQTWMQKFWGLDNRSSKLAKWYLANVADHPGSIMASRIATFFCLESYWRSDRKSAI